MMKRASGVLLHISSLPSPFGIGTMGREAFHFIDFLKEAGQSYWQVLPLGPTGYGDSPYQCFSSAAGNPYLIDLELLADAGLLTKEQLLAADCEKTSDAVDFEALAQKRIPVLRQAFQAAGDALLGKVWAFRRENREWIEDYALFMALKNEFDGAPVWLWPDAAVQKRQPDAMGKYSFLLKQEVDFYVFLQYLFFEQWNRLRAYANLNGIRIIGDIPIYVSPDSCDIWSHPDLFELSDDLSPRCVAGVPPDYYSATGQLWGNPIYRWTRHEADGYQWWIWRIRRNLKLFDVVRIDHFRGFESYWVVPVDEKTAKNGEWKPGPRMKLFNAVKKELGDVPVIAEDLGIIDDAVREFLEESGYPGMRVLIFGLDDKGDSEHLPHNYPQNCVAYTSTHDSESVCEQIMDRCTEKERVFAYHYLRTSHNEPMGWSAIKSVFASPARVAMTTMQDLLSLGRDARMNIPATLGGNWKWRVRREAINHDVAAVLRDITETYKR